MAVSNLDFYAINLLSIWILMVLLHGILLLHVNFYYFLLLLLFMLIINDGSTSATNVYFDKTDRLIYGLSVLWVACDAATSVSVWNKIELLRDRTWCNMVISNMPIILTLVAYLHRRRKRNVIQQSAKTNTFGYNVVLTYLVFVSIYLLLFIYTTEKPMETREDGIHLSSWCIGTVLSLINFSTINLYEKNIFSQRFIAELSHGGFIYLVQICSVKIGHHFDAKNYFQLYFIASIIYRKYSYNDQWIDSKLSGSILKMNMLLTKMFYASNYELINVLRDYVGQYAVQDGICQSFSGVRRLVIITDRQLMTHVLANPSIYEQGTPVRNATIIVGDQAFPKFVGKQYHKHKQHFQPGKLAELAQAHLSKNLVTCVDNLVHKWQNQDENGYIDGKTLWPNLHRLMFDIFGLAMVGYDYGSISGISLNDQIDDMTKVRPAALYYLNMLVKAAQTQCPFALYMFYHRHFNQKYKEARKTMQQHCRQIVTEYFHHSEQFERMEAKPIFYQIVQDMNKYDEQDRLTTQELVDDISDLLAAGTDSISTVLSWAIFYLSKESAIQDKIRQELIQQKLFEAKRFTYQELERCEYLRRFVKELLRHAPINVPLQRTAVKHDTLKEFNIYPGDELMLMARDVSQNDRYWVDSKKFDPDRTEWIDEKNDNIKHLLTFGGGARACPGRIFSQLQLRAVIALLLMRMEFLDTPGNIGGETSMLEGVVKPKYVKIKINFL